jgi:hypothetical protein
MARRSTSLLELDQQGDKLTGNVGGDKLEGGTVAGNSVYFVVKDVAARGSARPVFKETLFLAPMCTPVPTILIIQRNIRSRPLACPNATRVRRNITSSCHRSFIVNSLPLTNRF